MRDLQPRFGFNCCCCIGNGWLTRRYRLSTLSRDAINIATSRKRSGILRLRTSELQDTIGLESEQKPTHNCMKCQRSEREKCSENAQIWNGGYPYINTGVNAVQRPVTKHYYRPRHTLAAIERFHSDDLLSMFMLSLYLCIAQPATHCPDTQPHNR